MSKPPKTIDPPPSLHLLRALLTDFITAMIMIVFCGIPLAFRVLLGKLVRVRQAERCKSCAFFEGVVRHTRTAPLRNAFTYPVRYCLILCLF